VPGYNSAVPGVLKAIAAALVALFPACAAFLLSFAVSAALWFNLASALAAFAATMWFLKRRPATVAAATLCLAAAIMAPAIAGRLRAPAAPDPPDVVERISRLALPIETAGPGASDRDLAPLAGVWRGTRLVALGEATHGTSEFFRMKHRLTQFLVTRMGFRHFAMELDPRTAKHIDEYIQGERNGAATAELAWPWRMREYARMLEWMRGYNASAAPSGRIHFHGIDFQGERRDFRMARNVLDLLEGLPAESRVVLWAHNGHVSSGAGWMGSYLKQALRGQVYLAGFEFHHGRFTSRLNWVHTYEADPAGPGYYADALARTGRPILFLDFRSMARDPVLASWLDGPHEAHDLYEAYGVLRLVPAWVVTREPWPSLFDGVFYIERSTPAELVP
jgi:erythromycin esterase-like protein